MTNEKNIYRWVHTVYIMQGLPFALVNAVSLVIYKNFNMSNSRIALYTSLFSLPWFLKPLFAPAVENLLDKRTWVVLTQFLLAILCCLLTLSLFSHYFFVISAIIFFLMAFAAATHDMNVDGLYILCLDKNTQARLVGIKSLFFQLGRFVAQAGAVSIAGMLFMQWGTKTTWQSVLSFLAILIGIIAFYHSKVLPRDQKMVTTTKENTFLIVIKELWQLPQLFLIVMFILFYSFPENQLLKIVPLFMLDKTSHGGLALTTTQVGTIYGGIGFIGMLAGIVFSGFLLERLSLKKCLIPLTLLVAITNVGYLILSFFTLQSLWVISSLIAIAQLGYGLSNGLYMYFILLKTGRGSYPMSLYAIGTGLMGFSMMLGGATSGFMQQWLGYQGFFNWILLLSFVILGLIIYIFKRQLIDDTN